MDLAELKFVVDTKELERAAKEVANLGTEVSKLNKPMQELSSNTNRVSAATEKATKAAESKAKADSKAVDNSSKLDGLLDKLTNRYTDMAKGSTSAEAGVLQLARSLGATTEDALKPYRAILESIRELSKSPFDSAIGSVRSITQEYDSMTYRAELAAKGIFLTTTQLKEYSRIANEIKGKLKAADLDPTQGEGLAKFNSELKAQQDLYLGIANKVNTLKAAEKERNDLLNSQMKESVRLQEASDNLFKFNLLRHKQEQDGYKQDMLEMSKYYSELEKNSLSTRISEASALKKSSDDLFRLNQLKQDSTQKVYQQDMQEMRKYYSALEQEGNKNAEMLQKSSDEMFRMNQLRHKQDQDGYERDMEEMRKYYSALEKQSKQSIQSQPAQMDAAVDAYYKNQAKAADDAAKANAYLAKEMERVNRLNAEGESVTSATNNRLIRFEQELRKSGLTAEQQALKLAIYRKELLATQKAAGNRQIDYLSRALGPQITDIAVGLATGQAPLTILLQQGGQLRDQFALAGVAGADMGKMLIQASKSMVSSVKDVGMAIGQVFVSAVAGTGKAVVDFGMKITGTSFLLDIFRNKLLSVEGASSNAIAIFDKLGKAITLSVGGAVFAAIAVLVALTVQYFKVADAEKELTKSLAMSGASLAMSTEEAIEYAKSMNEVGIGTMDAMRMISEFANTSTDASIPLKEIISSAQDMEKYVGIASADTMKAFADITEKPVEGLINLAKTTGNVTAQTILQAEAAVKAGNNAEAARIAQQALSDSNAEVVKRMKNNLDPLQTLWLDIKTGIGQASEAIYDLLKSSTAIAVFRTVWETISVIVTEVWYVLKQTGNEISGIFSQIKAVMSGDFSGAKRIGDQMKIDAAAAREEQDKLVASIMNRNKAEKETLSITEEQRRKNRAGAKSIEKRIKDEKAPKTDAQKEADRLKKSFEDSLEAANKFYQSQIGAVENLTKSEIALNKVKEDNDYKKFSPQQKKQIDDLYEQAKANELLVQAEKDRAKQMDVIASLTGKADGFGKEYYTTLKTLDEAYVDGNISLEKYIELLNKLYQTTPQAKAFADAQSEHLKTMADIASSRASVSMQYEGDFKTADEKAAVKNLSDYRKSIADADATYEKQVADASKIMTATNLESAKEMYKAQADARKLLAEDTHNREQYLLSDGFKRQQAYANAFENIFKGMGDAIADFALTGKTSFGDLTKSIIADLIRMEMQMQMSSIYKGLGGFGGIMSMITGGNAAGNAMFDAGLNQLAPMAKGGAFTNSIVDSPTMFAFAKGAGVMGEAGPEAIMPLRRGADGSLGVVAAGASSSNVQVVVNNNSTATASAKETVDSRGNRKIEVTIGDMVAAEVHRKGSAVNTAVNSSRNQLVRR